MDQVKIYTVKTENGNLVGRFAGSDPEIAAKKAFTVYRKKTGKVNAKLVVYDDEQCKFEASKQKVN
jgi:hypothetical protein